MVLSLCTRPRREKSGGCESADHPNPDLPTWPTALPRLLGRVLSGLGPGWLVPAVLTTDYTEEGHGLHGTDPTPRITMPLIPRGPTGSRQLPKRAAVNKAGP